MPRTNLLHLKKLIGLLKNKHFMNDSRAYYEVRYAYAGSGQQEEWNQERQHFIANVHIPFIHKWNATPASIVLLTSPDHYRRYYAITSGQWGLIPVYPWTSRVDVEKQLKQIHISIGKRGKHFVSDRNSHIATWLLQQTMPSGLPLQLDEIVEAVWHQKRRSTCVSDEEEENLWRREQVLMQKYKSEGKDYSQAEKLVRAVSRKAESPASEKTRKVLARLKRDKRDLESSEGRHGKRTPLAFALTKLIHELPPLSPAPDPQRVFKRASFLVRLLHTL